MSTYKTQAEMTAALEFIQYLEQVKSGSLLGNQGVNRTLQRLSVSLDAMLEAVQAAKMAFLEDGGTVSFAANTLTWSSNLTLYFPGELSNVRSNVITAGSLPSLTNGKIVYVILDRTVEGAVIVPVVASNMLTFLTAMTGQPNRLDYLILARATADGITFFDGRRIVEGYSWTADGYVDTQYGQQTELTLVHDNEKENFRLMVTGGGNISWDVSTTEFSWSANLVFEFPSVSGVNRFLVASSPVVIPAGYVLYANLSRAPSGNVNLTPQVAAIGAVPTGDDVFIIAIHKAADGRLYLCNGQTLVDGETSRWGAIRTGVQWIYRKVGSGAQVTDFTESGAFPSRSYRVGSNELMVYRNGVKARVSDAYWSGSYPTGSLVGTILANDHYLEETDAVGTGNRIIWLQDDGTSEGHPLATHDPEWTWPAATDYLEAFIGIHGDGPSPVEDVGIVPEPGGGPLEGSVKLKAGANVTLAYDIPNNAITIATTISAGVTSVALSGGGGPQTGALALVESTTVDISEPGSGQFRFDIKAPFDAGLTNSTTPSSTNPYLTHTDLDFMSGFDVVWATDGTNKKVFTAGGVLRTNGVSYRSLSVTDRVEFSASNVYPADTLVLNAWNYAYLREGTAPGLLPRGRVASQLPDPAGLGVHPLDPTYKFLCSVFVSAGGDIKAFVKRGFYVELGFERAVTTPFTSIVWAGTGTYTSVTLGPPELPGGGIREAHVRLRVNVNTGTVLVGDRLEIRVRVPGYTDSRSYFATRATASTVDFDLVLQLDPDSKCEISGPTGITSVASAQLVGYVEGRFTVATDMGA